MERDNRQGGEQEVTGNILESLEMFKVISRGLQRIASLDNELGMAVFHGLADSPDPEFRGHAARMVGGLFHPEEFDTVPAVRALFDDQDSNVREIMQLQLKSGPLVSDGI